MKTALSSLVINDSLLHLAYLLTLRRSFPVADPDLKLRGERGPGLKKRFFQPFGPQFGLIIVGFQMTSLKLKLKNYRSYRDFTFTMY